MKIMSKTRTARILCAVVSVVSLVPVAKRIITGEAVNGTAITFLCVSAVFFILAVVVGRKSADGSGPPIV